MTNPVSIARAEPGDLETILALQHLAYQSEAKLLDNSCIPPLLETLDDVRRQCADGVILLKAVDGDGNIIGSVRGRAEGGTLHIGKLMVHPDRQGKGLGSRLLAAIAEACPQPRLELFTSTRSERNVRLYERAGFVRFREETAGPELRLVYLEKYPR